MLDNQSIPIPRQLAPSLWRSFDPDGVNAVLNDPAVFPLIAAPSAARIDMSGVLVDPRNVCLSTEGGVIVFIADEPGIYFVSANFLPKYRGRYALDTIAQAIRWMFTHTDCMTIQAQVPEFNRAAKWLCRAAGAAREFERQAIWRTAETPADVSFWAIRYDDWVKQAADGLVLFGRAFTKHLAAEFERHGHEFVQSENDEICDVRRGALMEMVYGGQPEKGVTLYNRWARFAGCGQVRLVSTSSQVVLDIGTAVIVVADGSFKVAKCR